MATCKDCLHYDVCIFHITENENEKCPNFKDKSQYAEVKHGEWIVEEFPAEVGTKKVSCSNCGRFEYKGKSWDVKEDALPFCSNCGARMDGGEG